VPDRLTKEGSARFAAVAEAHVANHNIPGVVALMACGEDVHVQARGLLATGGAAVARDSIFRIASTTKPITGPATLVLADEGLLDLDEPVDRLLPELASPRVLGRMDGPLDETVAASRAITARDLLTFTFGFGMVMEMFMAAEPWPVVAAAADLHLATIGPPNPDEPPEPDAWIARLGSTTLARWCWECSCPELRECRSLTCYAPVSSNPLACVTPHSGRPRRAAWRRPTNRRETGLKCGTPRTGSGVTRRRLVTGPPAWCRRWTTYLRSGACS